MSKNINVNPGQYKVRGRERQGEDIDQTRQREELVKTEERAVRRRAARPARANETARTPGKRR